MSEKSGGRLSPRTERTTSPGAGREAGSGKLRSLARPSMEVTRLVGVSSAARAVRTCRPSRSTRDVVGDGEDLGQEVRDVDDRGARRPQVPHDLEELVGLVGGQGRRGLVHDHQPRLPGQRAQDLDLLLLGGPQAADPGIGRDPEVDAARQLLVPPPHGTPVQHAAARGLDAEEDVLQDGPLGFQRQLLGDDRDAVGQRGVRRPVVDLAAVDDDLTGVRVLDAGEDLHQGRLARAVLADERVDRPAPDVHGHVTERLQAPVPLVDVLENRIHRRAHSLAMIDGPASRDGRRDEAPIGYRGRGQDRPR